MVLNYIDKPFILVSEDTGCVSISTFVSLTGVLVSTAGGFVGIKNWVIATRIQK